MSTKLRRVASVCQQHSHLQQLNRRAQKLTQLDLVLQAILPSQFSGRCHLVNLQQGRLTLMVDSASIGSLIRFQSNKIRQHFLQQHEITVHSVHVIVRQPKPLKPIIPRATTQQMILSQESATLIQSTAEAINNNPTLQKALTRLSGRVNKGSR